MTSEKEIYKVDEFTHKYDIIQGLEEFTETKTTELFENMLAFLIEKLKNTDGGMIVIYNPSDSENSTVEIRDRVDEDTVPAYFRIKRIYCAPDDVTQENDKNVYAQLTCNDAPAYAPANPFFCLNDWFEKEEDTDYVLKNMIKLIKITGNGKEK